MGRTSQSRLFGQTLRCKHMGIGTFLADLAFPARCVVCEEPGEWWCQACRLKTERLHQNSCPGCFQVSCVSKDCTAVLDGFVSVGYYHDPSLRAVIQGLKYHGGTCLLPAIEEFVRLWAEERREPWPWAGVADLSLQPLVGVEERVRERGFDQAVKLSEVLQQRFPWMKHIDALQRGPSVAPQARLEDHAQRFANAHGAFLLKTTPIPRHILLVDDVVTSGATMQEAAKLLKGAGATKVFGFSLVIGN
jgi:ComF family protein